jgi:hypothetical protein
MPGPERQPDKCILSLSAGYKTRRPKGLVYGLGRPLYEGLPEEAWTLHPPMGSVAILAMSKLTALVRYNYPIAASV